LGLQPSTEASCKFRAITEVIGQEEHRIEANN
jgi:hypothetical protein